MQDLLHDIETFCAKHDLTESQFGLGALNDKNFVPQFRDGRDIRFSTAEKVRLFMDTYGRAAA